MATAPRNTQDTPFVLEEVFSKASDLGGYMLYLLVWITKTFFRDASWSVSKSNRFPSNEKEVAEAKAWAREPGTCWVYPDDKGIVYVRIRGARFLSFLPRAQMKIWATKKVVKRLKSLNRPAAMGGHLSSIRVNWVKDPLEYAERPDQVIEAAKKYQRQARKANIRITLAECYERIWDGAIIMTPEFRNRVLAQSIFHRDPLVARLQKARCWKAMNLNTIIHTKHGLIKGNAQIAHPNVCDGTWDVIVVKGGAKEEITIERNVLVLLEPQSAKDKVVMDVQTFINNPYLFPMKFMAGVIVDFFAKIRKDITEGNMMMDFDEMQREHYAQLKDHVLDVGIMTRVKYSIMECLMRGIDVRKSPYMLRMWANAKVNNLLTDRKVRIPIPCVIKAQKISASVAKAAGYDMAVPLGAVKWCEGLGVMVVHDASMITEYENQGGDDQDDFHSWYQRTLDGRKVVIDIRNPNELGQYSIYEYVEGDRVFTYTTVDGHEMSFPTIQGPLPKQLFQALQDGDLTYTGLPSESLPPSTAAAKPYDLSDVDALIESTVGRGNPGGPINVSMLWSLTVGLLPKYAPCSQEQVVDSYTQPPLGAGSMDIEAIERHVESLLTVLAGLPMDRKFVESRFKSQTFRKHWKMTNLVEGRFTQLWNMMDEEIRSFHSWVETYGQSHAALLDEAILDLGGYTATTVHKRHEISNADSWAKYQFYLYQEAAGLLLRARKHIGDINRAIRFEHDELCRNDRWYAENNKRPRKMSDKEWVEVYTPIMEHFAAKPSDQERMNLALAFLAATYKIPTKGTPTSPSRISDNIVWASKKDEEGNFQGPFGYVMEALKYWGFVDILQQDETGNIINTGPRDSWTFTCPGCNRTKTSSDRKVMQQLLSVGMCIRCIREGK